ncbi:MAG: hypothetical protein AAGF02_14605 [Actinomycetota bacterium]
MNGADHPVIAVAWRPGDRAIDRLAGAVLDVELRRRLPSARTVRWSDEAAPVDGLVGERSFDGPRLVMDPRGRTGVGSILALADGLDAAVLRRRHSFLVSVGWFPPSDRPAVVVDVVGGPELVLHRGEVPVLLTGGEVPADVPSASGTRLADQALPIDLAAAVAHAGRVVTDHEGLAATAGAFGVEVEWIGAPRPPGDDVEAGAVRRLLDELAAGVHLRSLRRRPLDELGAELRRRAELDLVRIEAEDAVRHRLRSVRDELADRIVAHEHDLARLAERGVDP